MEALSPFAKALVWFGAGLSAFLIIVILALFVALWLDIRSQRHALQRRLDEARTLAPECEVDLRAN